MIVRMCVCMYVCSSWNEIKFLLYQINTRNPLITGFSLLITTLISHIIFMFQFNWCNCKLKWKLKSWNKISILVGWGGWFSILLTIVWFLGQSKNLSQNPIILHLVMPLCVHLHTPRAAVVALLVGVCLWILSISWDIKCHWCLFFLFWHTHISLYFFICDICLFQQGRATWQFTTSRSKIQNHKYKQFPNGWKTLWARISWNWASRQQDGCWINKAECGWWIWCDWVVWQFWWTPQCGSG